MNRTRIQRTILQARTKQGLSQTQFAKELSQGLIAPITKQTVSKWENGRTIPDPYLMQLIYHFASNSIRMWQHDLAGTILKEYSKKGGTHDAE